MNDIFKRPADSSFSNLQKLLEQAEFDKKNSRQPRVKSYNISFQHDQGLDSLNIVLDRDEANSIPLTYHSLSQVAGMAKIKFDMIERLCGKSRKDLVVDNLNTLFPGDPIERVVLIQEDKDANYEVTSRFARAVNGSDYSRLWDADMFTEVDDLLVPKGYKAKMPVALVHGVTPRYSQFASRSIAGGTPLFRGDQTSFGFFFGESTISSVIGRLMPGIMIWNSEVGSRSFGFHTFYFHEGSGAFLLWTPSNHKRKRYVHRGTISAAFTEYLDTLEDMANNFSARFTADVALFEKLQQTEFAKGLDEAVQRLNEKFGLSATDARAIMGYQHANQPISVWEVAINIAVEAGDCTRAEAMVDKSLVATTILKRFATTV